MSSEQAKKLAQEWCERWIDDDLDDRDASVGQLADLLDAYAAAWKPQPPAGEEGGRMEPNITMSDGTFSAEVPLPKQVIGNSAATPSVQRREPPAPHLPIQPQVAGERQKYSIEVSGVGTQSQRPVAAQEGELRELVWDIYKTHECGSFEKGLATFDPDKAVELLTRFAAQHPDPMEERVLAGELDHRTRIFDEAAYQADEETLQCLIAKHAIEVDEVYQRGVEAMREAAANEARRGDNGHDASDRIAAAIRALPLPKVTPEKE